MNQFITRRHIVTLAGLALVLIFGLIIFAVLTRADKYAVNEIKPDQDEIITLDYQDNQDILTTAQKKQLREKIVTMTSKEVPEGTKIIAAVRPSSIERPGNNETTFIVDSKTLQTSYLVSRFIDEENGLDIVNTLCVSEAQRVYDKDHCRAE